MNDAHPADSSRAFAESWRADSLDLLPDADMVDIPPCPYSKSQVVEAGKVIASKPQHPTDAAAGAFSVAHAWRNAHMIPLHTIRRELINQARSVQSDVITAARLKRMKSIRKKLLRGDITLYQIQDIGGCRAVLRSMSDVDRLIELYKDGASKHEVRRPYDYIAQPKGTGYRSVHLLLKLNAKTLHPDFNRHTIEVQIRTELQHAWATAVEAVGLVRNEDLKGGQGHADWLRFFQIMASEFAIEEQRPLVGGVPEDRRQRHQELFALEDRLNALNTLESYNQSLGYVTSRSKSGERYFIMQFDGAVPSVRVYPFSSYAASYEQYLNHEQQRPDSNTVLIEADKASDLESAYPNYFLDVKMFTERMRNLFQSGRTAPKYGNLSFVRSFGRVA